jgi:E3 ubiquitin-protein ligase SHPRH
LQETAIDLISLFIGPVPDAITQAFARNTENESKGPLNKRRKTSGTRSLRQINGSLTSHVPNGYIPLARFNLQLVSIL